TRFFSTVPSASRCGGRLRPMGRAPCQPCSGIRRCLRYGRAQSNVPSTATGWFEMSETAAPVLSYASGKLDQPPQSRLVVTEIERGVQITDPPRGWADLRGDWTLVGLMAAVAVIGGVFALVDWMGLLSGWSG